MNLLETFFWPWALLAAPPIWFLIWWDWLRAGRRATLRYSQTDALMRAAGGGSWALRARVILPVLRSLAVLAIVISIARPRRADEVEKVTTEGVALELVLDRSGSMRYQDMPNPSLGRYQTRLDTVKDVVRAFVKGDGDELEGRTGDLIGLTVFAAFPDTVCPLTRDHDHLIRALDDIEIVRAQSENGTAIGDALLLGIERIRNIGRKLEDNDSFSIKSRAVILLTDGLQNAGDYSPIDAAKAAEELGIKVYTIGSAPEFEIRDMGLLGRRKIPVNLDDSVLREVADITGGRYFRATDTDALRDVYQVIDELERTKIDEESYYLFEELAYRWVPVGAYNLPPALMVALVLLSVDVLLSATRLRHAL